jgi:hypothetical protein
VLRTLNAAKDLKKITQTRGTLLHKQDDTLNEMNKKLRERKKFIHPLLGQVKMYITNDTH